MTRGEFIKLERKQISGIVVKNGAPKCVAIMLDGTRRALKTMPGQENNNWLYDKNHLTKLIHTSVDSASSLFDMGIEVVIGPLISVGNLKRENFIPKGVERLMEPLVDEYSMSIFKKKGISVDFYGFLPHVRSTKDGQIIDKYIRFFDKNNPIKPKKRILIGIAFSTDIETKYVADLAIDYYKNNNIKPKKKDLLKTYYGFVPPPIDIFIRTNEIRASGGLTPLLTSQNTQFYFPVAPGIMSFTEKMLKEILYDYLFQRVLSGGTHAHNSISKKDAKRIRNFYLLNREKVIGIGERVGDMWLPRDLSTKNKKS